MQLKNIEAMSDFEQDTLQDIVGEFLSQEKAVVFDLSHENSPENRKQIYDPTFNPNGNLVPWSTAVREYWAKRLN